MKITAMAVDEWTRRHIRRSILSCKDPQEAAAQIQSLSSLHCNPVLFKSNATQIRSMWSSIASDPIAIDFLVHGTYHMQVHGFTSVGHKNQVIKHLSDSLRWVSKSAMTTDEFRSTGYKSDVHGGEDSVLSNDPWLVFLAIFQTLELDFTGGL